MQFELQQDLKKPGLLLSGFLQMLVLAYLAYITQPQFGVRTWVVLLLFCTLLGTQLAVSKAFLNQNPGHWLYFYQLSKAQSLILAKMIYSWLVSLAMSIWAMLVFAFLNHWPVEHTLAFSGTLFLINIGLASIFTFTSAISSKSSWGSIIFPILSLPTILPFMLIGSRACIKALNIVIVPSWNIDMYFLLALNVLVAGLSLGLFGILWRD